MVTTRSRPTHGATGTHGSHDTTEAAGPGAGGHGGRCVPAPDEEALLAVAGSVPDPELPVLTLAELGVVRALRLRPQHHDTHRDLRVEVDLTPTYTGCPAIETMSADIEAALRVAGATEVTVTTVLSPPWSTDDITEDGRRKLSEAGIAPPRPTGPRHPDGPVALTLAIRCPHCGSTETSLLSRFSSTACKALRRCDSCREPFDHVKEL